MISFHQILPENSRLLPQKVTDFLQSAVENSPTSDLTVEDALEFNERELGEIIVAMRDGQAIGAYFLMCADGNKGKILDVALFGADDFSNWHTEAVDFVKRHAKSRQCDVIWVISRKGWGRFLPDFKQIGVVYEMEVG